MQSVRGRKIHGEASDLREHGEFLKALQLIEEASILYQEDKDLLGLSEIQGMRSLTLRHLYRKTGDINYLILGKHASMAGVEIAEKAGVPSALPLFDLAKIEEELVNLSEAAETYDDAVNSFTVNPPESNNRPGVLADMKVHLYTCQYKAGDKSALQRAIGAVKELEESDEKTVSKYNYDVWMSGAHIRIAEMLRQDNLEVAKKHLQTAKEIIDANPDLKIRKEQWEKLAGTFN